MIAELDEENIVLSSENNANINFKELFNNAKNAISKNKDKK